MIQKIYFGLGLLVSILPRILDAKPISQHYSCPVYSRAENLQDGNTNYFWPTSKRPLTSTLKGRRVPSVNNSFRQIDTQYTCNVADRGQERFGYFDLQAIKATYYPNLDVAFYASAEDATLKQNELSENLYPSPSTTIFALIENTNQSQTIDEIPLQVDTTLLINLMDSYQFCDLNGSINIQHSNNEDAYRLYSISESGEEILVQSGDSIRITQGGNYRLDSTARYTNPDRSCVTSKSFTVTYAYSPEITNVAIEPNGNSYQVRVQIADSGNFEYELGENTGFQDSPEFSSVSPGIYLLSVKEKEGCGKASQLVSILGIPPYFTPNGDGYHDRWNILSSIQGQGTIRIQIFNRFGKLLKDLSSNTPGWDGTFNGKPLPSDSYWYQASFEDGKILNGHFVLKR